jgi:asparagine synthase (glutamine-hydrolysing)
MCGITGIVAPNAKYYNENLNLMIKSMVHRGPDEIGISKFNNCILGHSRLSIIDFDTGQQPMSSYDNLTCITLNGEIYGFRDIKKNLGDYPFKTNSDTEVILALYEKHGRNLLKILPGMFSFALWDSVKNQLFCARDRFGEKPFYYAIGKNNEFLFASEIRAIIASGMISPEIDNNSIANYLKRLYVNPGRTIYRNIFVLPPAHYLLYQDGRFSIKRYWKLPELNYNLKLNESVEHFKFLFENSVRKQLIADVPVAAFLSGGLDSSTIVASASKYVSKLTTMTFNFGDIDETFFAGQIAEKYNTNHIELHADDYNIPELLLEMQKVYDEPFADSSNIPTYLISKMAGNNVKVVLTGEGGDELLGGYSFWYRELFAKLKLNYHGQPGFLRYLQRYIKSLFQSGVPGKYSNENVISKFHFNQNVYFHDEAINKLMIEPITMQKNSYDFRPDNTLNDAMNMDILDYLPGDVLVKSDRASMANSLELRCPFLDKDLAQFCISLPAEFKISESEDKVILRRAYENQWTEEIRKRGKQGFGAPVNKWLEMEGMDKMKNEFLFDRNKRIYSIINYDFAKDFFNKNNYNTWILLVLSAWIEEHKI